MDVLELDADKNYMITVTPLGKSECVECVTIPQLEQLKKGLNGGLLEIVPLFNKFMGRRCIVFVDEEGKMKGLLPNRTAQLLWEKAYGGPIKNDYLVGNIVIIVGSPSFLAQL
jgi:hypothetical protein